VPYVTDAAEKAWLLQLLAKENRKHFLESIEGEGRSLYALLTHELASCKIPLSDFLHIAPPMQPRYYTISSSSSVHPHSVHITVSVTNTVTRSGGKVIPGLCSTYLSKLSPQSQARCKVFIRASTFKLPAALSTPIIMIGPGTGIAPMRALIQEREFQYKQQLLARGGDDGDAAASKAAMTASMSNVLYFGCKKRTEDFIYSDELEAYEQSGALTKLHLAFSRETSQKCYVQHLLKREENAASLVRDLDQGGYVYVCGATAMGEDVHKTIVEVVQTHKKLSHDEAEKFVRGLQTSGRYIQELWTA
jgi:NADPH-ferrihemoprotein reductase